MGLLVLAADCYPVALAGAGWGGDASLRLARDRRLGSSSAGWRQLRLTPAAAVGPGIGGCCYEVGDEVSGRSSRTCPDPSAGRMLDLRMVTDARLREAGVGEIDARRPLHELPR